MLQCIHTEIGYENIDRERITRMYITCDSGGSNGARVRMWKYQLRQFADRTRLEIEVSHFPRGTSKWNKVERRLFCYITKNWQGQPLVDVQTAIDLIGVTVQEL